MVDENCTSGTESSGWIKASNFQIFAFQPTINPQETAAAVDASYHLVTEGILDIEQDRWQQAAAEAFWRLEDR